MLQGHTGVYRISCFQLCERSSQTYLHERLKSGISTDLQHVPQEGYWCGPRGQLPPLVVPFPGNEDE